MNSAAKLEHRASSSHSKHEGESSFGLCDRLSRTRDNSQRQLPTDHDYAVSTREYQTDQSSLKSATAAARSVLGKRQKLRQRQKQPHRFRRVDTVTPYQAKALTDLRLGEAPWIAPDKRLRDPGSLYFTPPRRNSPDQRAMRASLYVEAFTSVKHAADCALRFPLVTVLLGFPLHASRGSDDVPIPITVDNS
jgi:hypothetical protein